MTKTYQWYYDGSAIGGATSKTHTLTSGQTDSNLIECRVTADYGTDSVGALAEFSSGGTEVFSDDFNRANEALETSANWTQIFATNSSFDVVSNALDFTSTLGAASSLQTATGATLSNDQYGELKIASITNAGGNVVIGVTARDTSTGAGTSRNFYYWSYNHESGNNLLELRTCVGGSFTTIDSSAQTLAANDVLRIECEGTTIRGKVNGALVCSGTNSDHTSGDVGIYGYQQDTGSSSTSDDFSCGDM